MNRLIIVCNSARVTLFLSRFAPLNIEYVKDIYPYIGKEGVYVVSCGRGIHAYQDTSQPPKEFSSYVENFIGLTNNPFVDSTSRIGNDVSSTENKRALYVSRGSWMHGLQTRMPLVEKRFEVFRTLFSLDVSPWKKQGEQVVYFSPNPHGYWRNWNEHVLHNWVSKDIDQLQKIRRCTSKPIVVKHHPSTPLHFSHQYAQTVKHAISNLEVDICNSVDTVLKQAHCSIVNHGSSCVLSCMKGIPVIYDNDHESCIPIRNIGVRGYHCIDHIFDQQLPNQLRFLDYIASQTILLSQNDAAMIGKIFTKE